MPRPPARRTRAVRQAPGSASSKPAEKKLDGANLSETKRHASQTDKQTRGRVASTPQRTGNESHKEDAQRAELTPTGDSNDHAIASSPAGNTTTTSIRPPTRARGYSSTLSLVGRKGDFNSRIGSTPGFESSILSNFKKRSRQPSLLQMMQADDDDDSSDFDDDEFLGGFSPQDESTPLNVARVSNAERQLVISPSRPPAISTPSSGESRKRKRQSANERIELGSSSARSSSLSTLSQTPESSPARQVAGSPSITMATPLSSSMGSPVRLVLDSQEEQTTVPNGADGPLDNDIIQELLPKVTTSSIKSKYLPQRRMRPRQRTGDGEDLEDNDSALDSDEDELTGELMRRPQRKKGLSNATQSTTNVRNRGAKKNKRVVKGSSNTVSQNDKSQRTYSRQNPQASNKENDVADDSSLLSSPPPSEDFDTEPDVPSRISKKRIISQELKQQAQKFAEVDRWEMEFEDVSVSENSPAR